MARVKYWPILIAALSLTVSACAGSDATSKPSTSAPSTTATAAPTTIAPDPTKVPTLTTKILVKGLQIPWDIAFLPTGDMLYTERDHERITLRKPDGSSTVVLDSPTGMWHSGETGLMSVLPASDYDSSHDVITCHGFKDAKTQDVRVVRWHLGKKLTFVRNLVTGLPSTSGRHGGCALEHGENGDLYVGTGDAADGRNPQNLKSGGGKVLRINETTGKGLSDNPFASSSNEMKQRVWSYGHRNVQGLSYRSADGTVWSIEQGSFRDDEVNRSVRGGNFGWSPLPSFNEQRPMTDHSLPGKQIDAAWSSGKSTIATSGGTFLSGEQWGAWRGALIVASLKDTSLTVLQFNKAGKFVKRSDAKSIRSKYGRLRAVVEGPDGALYVTTSNGSDDKVLRITAR